METYFGMLPENSIQVSLIQKMAKKMWVSPDSLSPHWVDLYSPVFRELWESGVHDTETIEERLYTPTVGSNYADMVASILIGKPDKRLTE
jgi:hypothetical protein